MPRRGGAVARVAAFGIPVIAPLTGIYHHEYDEMNIVELETDRIKLRQWTRQDLPAFAELNADPAVMKYFPSVLTEELSNSLAEKCQSLIAERGWGFWAAELKSSGEFMGFIGLHTPKASLPFAPCVEVGWRLARRYWGCGYASEAARRALSFAFETLDLPEVVAFTAVRNARSRAVMERIGMVNALQNFDHPDVPISSSLCTHVLYKLRRDAWRLNQLA